MKNATVFSFFNSNNIGDLLIADTVSKLFSNEKKYTYCDISNFQRVDICAWRERFSRELPAPIKIKSKIKKILLNLTVFRGIIGAIKARKSNAPYIALKNCEESDTVIFAGGNSLMELECFPASLEVLGRTVKLLKEHGKKIAFCFCGVGPFRTKLSYKILKEILLRVDFISVRDDASYALVKKVCPHVNIEIWRDPVFLIERARGDCCQSNIGVNVYFGYDKKKKSKMKKAFVGLLKELRRVAPERNIYLFSSEMTDLRDAVAVKEAFLDDERIIVRTVNSVEGLFSLYDDVCGVIGTRMHTVITATVSHKPVVAISWQSKVASLMEFFNQERLCIDMNCFINKPRAACEALLDVMGQENEIIRQNDSVLMEIRRRNEENIKKFKERF